MTSSSLSENFSTTSLIFYNLVTGLHPKKVNLPSDLFSSGLGSKTGKICVKKEQYTCLSRHTLFCMLYLLNSRVWIEEFDFSFEFDPFTFIKLGMFLLIIASLHREIYIKELSMFPQFQIVNFQKILEGLLHVGCSAVLQV